MAEEKTDIDDDTKDDPKTAELRDKFSVNITKFESENYNNEEAKCLLIKLTDKQEHKYQIYQQTFTVGDIIKIKKEANLNQYHYQNF